MCVRACDACVRVAARGRDSEQSIKERVARSKQLEPVGPFVIDVVNEGTKEEGIANLVCSSARVCLSVLSVCLPACLPA